MIPRLLDDGRWLALYVVIVAIGGAAGAVYAAGSCLAEWIRGRSTR